MADAQNQWKRLDDHPHLTSAMNKPPDSNGNPYIPGAVMFPSLTIVPGTIFVGERWCETHEAVTVILRNMTSVISYNAGDVRSSVASEIERIGGYNDACILKDLPTSTGRYGPYKVVMAAAAALCLIEAEGVT